MLNAVLSEAEMARRWQLVIGADVGSIQYIPAVEELEVGAVQYCLAHTQIASCNLLHAFWLVLL